MLLENIFSSTRVISCQAKVEVPEPVPKLIKVCAKRARFWNRLLQFLRLKPCFSLAKLRFLKVAVPKLKFWNSLVPKGYKFKRTEREAVAIDTAADC
jgi:hypothetical protein